MHLFSYVCLTQDMHSLCICTLHNSKTLDPLTWTRVRPSHCYEHTRNCSHVLYRLYITSVNIRHSNWPLRFIIPYIFWSTVLTLRILNVLQHGTHGGPHHHGAFGDPHHGGFGSHGRHGHHKKSSSSSSSSKHRSTSGRSGSKHRSSSSRHRKSTRLTDHSFDTVHWRSDDYLERDIADKVSFSPTFYEQLSKAAHMMLVELTKDNKQVYLEAEIIKLLFNILKSSISCMHTKGGQMWTKNLLIWPANPKIMCVFGLFFFILTL